MTAPNTSFPFIGDKPRYCQLSLHDHLCLTNVGFRINAAGALITPARNPPQFFAEAVNATTVRIKCPSGNPEKVWALFTVDTGDVAAVQDFSTIGSGYLDVIFPNGAPAAAANVHGIIAYGRNGTELKGAVPGVAPEHIRPLASAGAFKAQGLLKQGMTYPVEFITGAAGAVISTRAPLGVTVAKTGTGVYTITTGTNFPYIQNNWSHLFHNSESRPATITYEGANIGQSQRIVITYDDLTDMGNGERAGMFLVGSVSKYPSSFGATLPGGPHADLKTRNISNYGMYDQESPLRDSVQFLIRLGLDATGLPDPDTSSLPPGTRVERISAGTYRLYFGSVPQNGIVGAVTASDGDLCGIIGVNGDNGYLDIEYGGGVNPIAPLIISGLFVAVTSSVR